MDWIIESNPRSHANAVSVPVVPVLALTPVPEVVVLVVVLVVVAEENEGGAVADTATGGKTIACA